MKPALILSLASALCMNLAGCASVGGHARPLPSEVPPAYVEAPVAALPDEADLSVWWREFNDPLLTELVERGLGDNLDLRQTVARIDQARQQEVVAGASKLPQLQADGSAGRTRISEHAIAIPPGLGGGQGGGSGGFGLPGTEFNTFRIGVDASWELDLFGGAQAGVEAAKARAQSAEWSRRDLQVSLAAEIADHYLMLRALQRREAIAWDELARQRELLSIVTARADAGFISHLDVDQQQAQVTAAEAQSYPLEAQVRAEIHALGVLVGEPPEALQDRLSKAAAAPAAPPIPPAGLPSDLLRRRPDIRRAEREVAAAAADVGVAASDLYPKLSLSAQPGVVSTSLSNLVQWGSRNYSLSAGLIWPIFEGGRLRAALAKADARQTELLLAYRATVLTGLKDVEDALARYQADEAQRGSLQASLDDARGAEALAFDQQRAGITGYANVLATRQAVIAGEDQLTQAETARAQDVVALYRALGGGWSEREPQESQP